MNTLNYSPSLEQLVDILHRQGTQGQLSDAAKLTLAAEFNTENEDDVIKKILEQGNVQETQVC